MSHTNDANYTAVLSRIGPLVTLSYYRRTAASDGETIFTVPSGYRPSETKTFWIPAMKSGSADIYIEKVELYTSGNMIVSYQTDASSKFFSFTVSWAI